MALIPYLEKGTPLTADKWNTFYAELDARLFKTYSGQSILLWGQGADFGFGSSPALFYSRQFYFGPSRSSSTWDSIAQVSYDLLSGSAYKRRYDHSVFSQIVASLSIATDPIPGFDPRPPKDDDWSVVRLAIDDTDAFMRLWTPRIWPDGGAVSSSDSLDALSLSLEAHQRNVDGKDYFVYIDNSNAPEYIHKWSPVEIILGDHSSFNFPDNYNKYNIFRFHNLGASAVTVQFGSHFSFTIPPMQCRCVRRTAVDGTYTLGYNYFHKLLPGDPWFLKWNGGPAFPWNGKSGETNLGNGTDWSNITDIYCGVYIGAWLYWNSWDSSYNRFPQQYDFSKIWDVSSIYCNPGYVGGKFEVQTPVGGWFPAVSDGVPLGDLCFHKGKLLIVNPAGQFRVHRTQPMNVPVLTQPPAQITLRKNDGSIALGVEDVMVTRGTEDIPEDSNGDPNWLTGSVLDGTLQPLYFYIVLLPRDGGNDPKLAPGDQIKVSFTHLTDDQKFFIEFDGMASFASNLAEAGITLTYPYPNPQIPELAKQIELKCTPPRDIISLSCNLVNSLFSLPARTIGDGANHIDPLVLPPLWSLASLFEMYEQTVEVTVQYFTWEIDGDGNYINVQWTDVTYETTSIVSSGAAFGSDFFSFYDTVGQLLTYLRAIGGVLTTSAAIQMTIFGPMVATGQSIGVKYPGNGFDWNALNFGLTKVGQDWFLVLKGFSRLAGAWIGGNFGWAPFNGADANFTNVPGVTPDSLKVCYSRFDRYWQNYRFFGHDASKEPFMWAFGQGGVTSEHPMLKSFYESKPFKDGELLAVGKAPTQAKAGISFLGPFPSDPDILTRLSAWANYSVLTFQGPEGPTTYNFNRQQPWQIAYYGNVRQRILSNTPVGEDGGGLVKNALPLSIEDYNSAASAINVITGPPGGSSFFSNQAHVLFSQFGLRPGKGLGYLNFRPRDQWVSWDAAAQPEVAQWMEARGIDVLSGIDLPESIWEYVDKNQLWAIWEYDTGGPSTTEMRPGYSEPIKMHVNGWGDYLFKSTFFDQTLNGGQGALRTPTLDELKTRLNNYRWVSIADAQRLHQNLGIPFWFEELAVPANLLIRNAAWTVLDSRDGPGFGGIQISRAVGFVNQDNGQWVLDSDANGAIRANVDPVDYCCYFMSWGSNPGVQVLYDADYGELHERFYVGEDLPVPATQLIRANKYYLYRRYGGRQARSVVFPRNYADFERNYDSTIVRYFAPGGFQHIPRVAVEHEEGLPAEVTDLGSEHLPLNPDESVITTTFENGQLSIYPYGEAF